MAEKHTEVYKPATSPRIETDSGGYLPGSNHSTYIFGEMGNVTDLPSSVAYPCYNVYGLQFKFLVRS